MLLLLLGAAGGAEASADCPFPVPAAIFETQLSEVEDALDNRNLQQMSQRLSELDKAVPCLVQPLTPAQAGRYHLIHGVNRWIAKENTPAKLHFSSAKAAAPELGISTEVFPAAHQIHKTFSIAPQLDDAETAPQPAGALYFDGTETLERPLYRPTILQVAEGGKVSLTLLLEAGSPLPDYPGGQAAAAPEEADAKKKPEPPKKKAAKTETSTKEDVPQELAIPSKTAKKDRNGRGPLIAATAASAAAAAGSFLLFSSSYTKHAEIADKTPSEITGDDAANAQLYGTLNQAGLIGTAAMGAATLGLGTVLVLRW
jgi:hypothetical protein